MTHPGFVQTHYSHAHLHHSAVSASLALLLIVSTGCTSNQTDKRLARDPDEPDARVEVIDAGPKCDRFDQDYRDAFKTCAVDDDCEIADVEFTCRGTHGIFGVAKADREEFNRCLPDPAELRGCANGLVPVTRADDGRKPADDLHDVHARCIAGSCRTQIEDRNCGASEKACTGTQLCVSFQDELGVTQFQCADNLCGTQKLDCECAESVCSVDADKIRMCAIDLIDDSDVYCKRVLR